MGSTFEKATNNISWSREVYEISQVLNPKKNTVLQPKYKIKTLDNKQINEFFFHNDLRVINKDILKKTTIPEKFIVQKILEDRTINVNGIKRKELLIKWKGYKEPTYELYSVMKVEIPKLVKQYEKK